MPENDIEQYNGLSDESRGAIRGGVQNIFDNKPRQDTSEKPKEDKPNPNEPTDNARQSGAKDLENESDTKKPSLDDTKNRTPIDETKKPGALNKAKTGADKLGSAYRDARIGTDIARNPGETAKEASKAAATEVGKKAVIGAAGALTGGTGAAALKIGDKAIQAANKVPGFGSISKIVAKNRWIFLAIVIVFVITVPSLGFVIGISMLGGGGSGTGATTSSGIPNGTAMVNGVVLYKQGDGAPWAGNSYGCGGTTIASSGCGVTSIAMVLATYGIQVTPADIAKYSLQHGYRICGQGTSWGIFDPVARAYGLPGAKALGTNINTIVDYLGRGYPVIASMKGPSKFTRGGHFIVLTGYSNGTFYINDPGGRNITQATAQEVSGALLNSWILEKPATNST